MPSSSSSVASVQRHSGPATSASTEASSEPGAQASHSPPMANPDSRGSRPPPDSRRSPTGPMTGVPWSGSSSGCQPIAPPVDHELEVIDLQSLQIEQYHES